MKEQEVTLTIQAQKPYAGYGGIFMPNVASPEVLQTHQSPRAGNKGGNAQTDKEEENKLKKFVREQMTVFKRMEALKEVKKRLDRIEKRLPEAPRLNLGQLEDLISDATKIAKIADKQKEGVVGGNIYPQAVEIADKAYKYKEQLSREYVKKGGNLDSLNNKIIKWFIEAIDPKDNQEEEAEEPGKSGEKKLFENSTRQRPAKPEKEEVFENAKIQDAKERVSRAQQLLDRELSEEQQFAVIQAHNVGVGELGKDGRPASIFNYTQAQISEKARLLKEAGFSNEERRLLMEAGIAGEQIDTTGIASPGLVRIIDEVNREADRLGADRDFASTYLQDQTKRIRDLVDRDPAFVPPPAAGAMGNADYEQAMTLIARMQDRRDTIMRQERAEADIEPPADSLVIADLDTLPIEERFDAASYVGSRGDIKSIADAVQNALTIPSGVNNEFLRDRLRELFRITIRADLPSDVEIDANRLRRDIDRLMEAANSKNARAAEAAQKGRGLYGEIRMSQREKVDLVERAILADPNPPADDPRRLERIEAWRELEGRFNKHFAQADVNSSDQWRDALGQAVSLELDEFLRTLTNASESRTRIVSREDQERLRSTIRRLRQELDLRQYLHNLSYQVNTNAGAEDIIRAASAFKAEDSDVAFRKRGVSQVLHLYEQAMLQVTAQNGGYLPATAMVNTPEGKYGEVEAIVLAQAKRAVEVGALPRDMADWEIRRAIALARGMGVVTGRFFEIAAEHGIPKNNSLNSWWANGLVKNIAYFRHLTRFDVGQKQNAILGYRLEGWKTKLPWSTSELKDFKKMGTADILDNLVNEHGDERLIQMKNPFHIGSIFTQTGWRWKGDKVNLSSAAAHLRLEDVNNPIIGVGLLIESNRGDLAQHDDIEKQKKAHDVIHHGLELASEITPLKLFYNLTGLRQDVLRKYYGRAIREDVDNAKGSIFIEGPKGSAGYQLQEDLKALALVQERLVGERIRLYEDYLEAKKTNPNLQPPILPTELDFRSLITGINEEHPVPTEEVRVEQREQAERVEELAEHIKHEFEEKHMGIIMDNLHNKGWKVPWVLGTDDIPYAALNFSKIPGDSIARRWNADIAPVVQTAGLYGEFISNMSEFKSAGDIVKSMKKIHGTLSGHDSGVANEAMRYLAEGVAKFYKKDLLTRLPAGAGKLNGFLGGNASYAQVAFGRGQMAWDELDIKDFLHGVHASGLVDHHQYNELKSRLGARWYNIAWSMGRVAVPLGILAFVYMMLNDQLEEIKKVK